MDIVEEYSKAADRLRKPKRGNSEDVPHYAVNYCMARPSRENGNDISFTGDAKTPPAAA